MKAAPLLLLLFALLGQAAMRADTTQNWAGSADITFSGTSTLHDWAGKVAAQPFTTSVTLSDSGQLKRVKAEVTVKAAQMDTAEPKRDDNMRKAMKAGDYPLIRAVIDASADSIVNVPNTPAFLPMTLTLLGRPQKITGVISHYQKQKDKVTFDLDFPVSMKNSGISVPSVLLFIRVGDEVKIRATVTLKQP
jgi:polyisoprenoid-binding protein YceI